MYLKCNNILSLLCGVFYMKVNPANQVSKIILIFEYQLIT